jgi:hypothetical protein
MRHPGRRARAARPAPRALTGSALARARRYAHVDVGCLRRSPTARWWRGAADAGRLGTLVPWLEEAADYDGIAVVWGLGHKAASAAACAQACLDHAPGPAPANGAARRPAGLCKCVAARGAGEEGPPGGGSPGANARAAARVPTG